MSASAQISPHAVVVPSIKAFPARFPTRSRIDIALSITEHIHTPKAEHQPFAKNVESRFRLTNNFRLTLNELVSIRLQTTRIIVCVCVGISRKSLQSRTIEAH